MVFGDKVAINANSDIVCRIGITIGDRALISWECLIMDTDFHSIYDKNCLDKKLNDDKEIS